MKTFLGRAVLLSGLRNREGLTQSQLGEMIGVAQYHISRMERGRRAIGKALAKKIGSFIQNRLSSFLIGVSPICCWMSL